MYGTSFPPEFEILFSISNSAKLTSPLLEPRKKSPIGYLTQ